MTARSGSKPAARRPHALRPGDGGAGTRHARRPRAALRARSARSAALCALRPGRLPGVRNGVHPGQGRRLTTVDGCRCRAAIRSSAGARLLEWVLEIDLGHCANRGGALWIVMAILHAPVIEGILRHLRPQVRMLRSELEANHATTLSRACQNHVAARWRAWTGHHFELALPELRMSAHRGRFLSGILDDGSAKEILARRQTRLRDRTPPRCRALVEMHDEWPRRFDHKEQTVQIHRSIFRLPS